MKGSCVGSNTTGQSIPRNEEQKEWKDVAVMWHTPECVAVKSLDWKQMLQLVIALHGMWYMYKGVKHVGTVQAPQKSSSSP